MMQLDLPTRAVPEPSLHRPWAGLTSKEAAERLILHGYNELSSERGRSIGRILLRMMREPMLLLLLGCAGVYFALGDAAESVLLLSSALGILLLTLFQEARSERALSALRDLSSPRALVIRDGEAFRIHRREVVPGDLIRLAEGDRVPADCVLVQSLYLSADESILTGESYSVVKNPWPSFVLGSGVSAVPRESRIFAGTLIVAGQGLGVVTATGVRTDLGRIGQTLRQEQELASPLQAEIRRLAQTFGVCSIAVSFLIVVLYGALHGDWPQGILAGLSAAMSLIPEEFAVVLAVFFAMGAWRLSRQQVLVRHPDAIERLGGVSVLCVDKTGTLTRNQMAVHSVWPPDSTVLSTAILACDPIPFDPMERAILAARASHPAGESRPSLTLLRQYPLASHLPVMTCVWSHRQTGERTAAAKGAPEAVLALCQMPEEEREAMLLRIRELAAQGLRVLGIASAPVGGREQKLPSSQKDFHFRFEGLLSLEDPVRSDARRAVLECQRAGIRVCMLTGDSPDTARSIARQVGIAGDVLTGAEIDLLSDLRLSEAVLTASVFARVKPEQKLRIVTVLQKKGARVAMTGDGVNDAPSLRWADVGVAMGQRGTDVAREASDIVLLDDRFGSLVEGIGQGRRILSNLRKALDFILAVHVPIAGLTVLPVLLKLPLLLHPAHIVFLELISDPVSSVMFEAEKGEKDLMNRSPHWFAGRMVGPRRLIANSLNGLVVLIAVFGQYWVLLSQGRAENSARAIAFITLVLSNLTLALLGRRRGRREPGQRFLYPVFNLILPVTVGLLLLVHGVPRLKALFRFGEITVEDVLVSIVLTGGVYVVNRAIRKRRKYENQLTVLA